MINKTPNQIEIKLAEISLMMIKKSKLMQDKFDILSEENKENLIASVKLNII